MESINLERKDWGSDVNRESTASSIKKDKLKYLFLESVYVSVISRDSNFYWYT
ncbi:MAG: hypothetical protein Ct9H300mP18_10210 [Candidatus Neomarinimicrobiota bacterium]|nr:MAG: hypothetical protein Ct9H300mP18_10210 [Candidatus Neomarinimicrobiota bacterium]